MDLATQPNMGRVRLPFSWDVQRVWVASEEEDEADKNSCLFMKRLSLFGTGRSILFLLFLGIHAIQCPLGTLHGDH